MPHLSTCLSRLVWDHYQTTAIHTDLITTSVYYVLRSSWRSNFPMQSKRFKCRCSLWKRLCTPGETTFLSTRLLYFLRLLASWSLCGFAAKLPSSCRTYLASKQAGNSANAKQKDWLRWSQELVISLLESQPCLWKTDFIWLFRPIQATWRTRENWRT